MKIRQLHILLHDQVEEVTSSEVTKLHEVADGLHDIPAERVEGAPEDDAKLANED